MIDVAVVVAVWFIINTFFVDLFDVLNVWYVLDAVMFSGLALALNFNFLRKRREDGRREASGPVTCRYLEVNAAFYLTAAVMILFLHNRFSLLANGADSLGRQPPGLGNLGGRGHGAAAGCRRHRLRPVARGWFVNHAFQQWRIATNDLVTFARITHIGGKPAKCTDFSEFVDEVVADVDAAIAAQGIFGVVTDAQIKAPVTALLDRFNQARLNNKRDRDERYNEVEVIDDVNVQPWQRIPGTFKEIADRVGPGYCDPACAPTTNVGIHRRRHHHRHPIVTPRYKRRLHQECGRDGRDCSPLAKPVPRRRR